MNEFFKHLINAKVKCRKITHGYCTLKIEPGLHKFKFQLYTGQNAHKTTRTSQAREFKFKSTICVSAHNVTFCTCTDQKLYAPLCITISYQQYSFIYMLLLSHIDHSVLSNRNLLEVPNSSNIHRPTPFTHRFIFNKLFRFADALLFVLVLIIKFKSYIKLNHLLNHTYI